MEQNKLPQDQGSSTHTLQLPAHVTKESLAEFSPTLFEAIANGKKSLVIDASSSNYMNSAGIGVLVKALVKAKKAGADIEVVGLRDSVQDAFKISKLDQLFKVKFS